MTRLTMAVIAAQVRWWLHGALRRHEVFLDLKSMPYCADCRKFHRG